MKITNRAAVNAQQALATLSGMNLPIKTSLSLARLSVELETQVHSCILVRDQLISQYKIKISLSKENSDKVEYNITIEGTDSESTQKLKEAALTDFTVKINELMDAEGEDVLTKVYLPDNIEVNSATLKAILPFVVDI